MNEQLKKLLLISLNIQQQRKKLLLEFKDLLNSFNQYKLHVPDIRDEKHFTTHFKHYVFWNRFIYKYGKDMTTSFQAYYANLNIWPKIYPSLYDQNYLFYTNNINKYVLLNKTRRGLFDHYLANIQTSS